MNTNAIRAYPVSLIGKHVRLEAMDREHVDALAGIGLDPALWAFNTHPVDSPADMARYVDIALAERARGEALPFATRSVGDDRIVGSTRFGAIDRENRHVEIGWTWISPPWQRTAVNTEAKLLMLRHAFETWGCHRVELKTDATNERSRRAMERIGATYEGCFRKHMVRADGSLRDSVYYSILDDEWPAVRERLEGMLRRAP